MFCRAYCIFVFMKVYVSGKITGTSDYEEKFAERAYELKKAGYTPVNPVPLIKWRSSILKRELTHAECMKFCLEWLSDCEGINFLPDWQNSPGAKEEHDFAVAHDKVIVELKFR